MARMNNEDRKANEIRLSYLKALYGLTFTTRTKTVPTWAQLPEDAKRVWRTVAKRAEELFS